MDRQMRTFMAEGGLKDDGMNIDPVSGNEIPPGSMAEEVRDDISAQLSEGEYVVPADVVKYFGVKFFEELRSEAKAGLGQMEANGRIGGEPVPAGGPRGGGNMMNDVTGGLTVEEMAQLEAVMTQGGAGMGMAVGGVVPQQYGMPMAQPQYNTGMMQQGMQVGGVVKGYTSGGLEQEMETVQSYNTFDPSDYSLGYSFRPQEQQQQFIMLYGPNGEVVSLMLPRDQAEFQRLSAQGYTTEQPGLTKDKAEEDKKPEDNYGGMADGGQESPFGGPAASLGDLNDVNNDGKVDFGDTFLGDLLGLDGKIGVQGPGLKDSLQGARRGGGKGKGKGKGTPASTPSIGTDGFNAGPAGGDAMAGLEGGSAPSGSAEEAANVAAAPGSTTSAGLSGGAVGLGDISESGSGMDIGDGGGESSGGGTSGGGATGGGGADSGTGPSGGNASPGASGVGAPGVAGGEVGAGPGGTDAVGPMNKGGLASKRRKPKRNTANMAKGGLASPKKK